MTPHPEGGGMTGKKRNVPAQEDTVSALWDFADAIGSPIAPRIGPHERGEVDRARLDAVGATLKRIMEAFGFAVTSIQ